MRNREEAVRASAALIERYLARHPCAADSACGIQHWWLGPPYGEEPLAVVLAALEELEVRGIVTKRRLEDGAVIYAGPGRKGG